MRSLLPETTKAPFSSAGCERARRTGRNAGLDAAGLRAAGTAVGSGHTLRSLLLSTAAVLLIMAPGLPTPVCAQALLGGTGGAGNDGSAGGIGGVGNPTGAGGTGGSGGAGFGGGGGGGPGLTAGAGGASGTGGGSSAGAGGTGGTHGIVNATLNNNVSLSGSNGGNGIAGSGHGGGGGGGGGGGYGAVVTGGGTSANSGIVRGGDAGFGGVGGEGSGNGRGGNGGVGGIGVLLTQPGTFTNSNTVIGGEGGGGGGSLNNAVMGGTGGTGGIGASLAAGSTLNNTGGFIAGGNGGYSNNGRNGGSGGGTGGTGGIGVQLGAGSTVNNSAMITGGNGGYGSTGGTGGAGGIGIATLGAATINNNGAFATILGGRGNSSSSVIGGKAPGGAGISGGGPLIINNNNAGIIGGGQGASGPFGENGPSAAGGIGIVGANLTINNTGGTIRGGLSGNGTTPAYAIQLTGGTNYVGTGGTITGGVKILGGASFQPALNGTVPGTMLAVTGPVTFAANSFYNVRITPTATDSVTATGSATLSNATVNVLAGQGTYAMRQYTILTAAGGLNGTFAPVVNSNFAFLMPTVTNIGNNVVLNIQAGTATGAGTIDYRTAAATQNQRAVAGGLTAAGMQNGGTGAILTAFNQLTVPQAQAAFDSISGEGITGAQNVAYSSSSLFVSSITDQLVFYGAGTPNSVTLTNAPPPLAYVATRTPNSPIVTRDTPFLASRTWRAWATGFGGAENISGQAGIGSAAQNNSVYGGSMGVDYQVTPNYLAGVAIGGTDGSFSVGGRNTFGRTTGGHAAFYSLANFGPFYGAGTTSVSYFGNKTTRNIAGFGGLTGETDRGNFGSHEFRSRAEFGWHTGVYGATLTPFVALEIAQLRSNGFTETAISGPGLLALNVQGQTGASVPGYLGARIARPFLLDNGMVFTPTLQAAYVHEFGPQRNLTAGLVNLPGATFLVDGARPSSNAAQVKAGGELTIGPRVAIFVTFDGEFANANQLFAGKGGLKVAF